MDSGCRCIGAVSSLLLAVSLPAVGEPHQGRRAEWMRESGWGVFIHYLGDKGISSEDWNKRVDGFDVEGLAKQLESVGARYLFLTLGQNSGHYLSPNKTYDSFVGIEPSKCSRRDLVADLYKVLEPRGIKLLVYLPAGAPDTDAVACERLGWSKGPARNAEFQNRWERVIAEWSRRWGSHVKGWWFDGCYWPNAMYRHAESPNFASLAAAARAGNPDSAVAFNRGVVVPIISVSEQEDYTAGEINDPAAVANAEFWRDGAQFHMLSYLGTAWSQSPPRFTEHQVAEWTARLIASGGSVTWDVPTDRRGLIPEPFIRQLTGIGRRYARLPIKP